MGIDEARQHVFAVQLHDLGVRRHHPGVDLAHGLDFVVLNEDAAAVVNRFASFRHGNDEAVFQQDLFHDLIPLSFTSARSPDR